MSLTDSKRGHVLDLLYGPAMQVTVRSEDGTERSWTIPKALLSHHSGYFSRLCNFKEGEEGKVVLQDSDPDIFRFFVEFMYYGRYTFLDDLKDVHRVRDSARAWVLADYVDAVEFKNFAIKNLYNINFPPANGRPKVGIGASAIEYCCKNTTVDSSLYNLYLQFAIKWFHDVEFVSYTAESRSEWNILWDDYHAFRNTLLYCLNQHELARTQCVGAVEEYMEKLEIKDEPANTS